MTAVSFQSRVELHRVSEAEMDAWIAKYGGGIIAYPWAISPSGRLWPRPPSDVIVFTEVEPPYFVIWR